MLDKNKYNSPCSFSEHVISYLYKEIGAPETNDFEVHLKSCTTCQNELSGFDIVRSSISEWRKEKFSVLETPAFNFLPDPIEENTLTRVSAPQNWWDAFKNRIFLPAPVWATSAFAALIVCVGLAFIILNYSKYDEVAEISNGDNTIAVSHSVKAKNESDKNSFSGSNQSEKPSENIVKEQQLNQENVSAAPNVPAPRNFVTKIKNDLNTTTDRISTRDSNKSTPLNRKPITNRESKKAPLSKPRNAHFLADIEDFEDKSLRLADLFDEADAK